MKDWTFYKITKIKTASVGIRIPDIQIGEPFKIVIVVWYSNGNHHSNSKNRVRFSDSIQLMDKMSAIPKA